MRFLRRNTDRHSKLGRGRKKKQIWRKPKGRHNKMRDQKRGYPAIVKIGYRKSAERREKLKGMKPVMIMNTNDLDKIKAGETGILGKVGMKKKIDIIRKADERGIRLHNVNVKKFMKKHLAEKNAEKKQEEGKK
jgi:large subunit ribosomal protein L32e